MLQSKVLIYTSCSWLFRSSLIGNLFEICQKYPVVLLSEKMDLKTQAALKRKDLFPKLEDIILMQQFDKEKGIFYSHKNARQVARSAIMKYKPSLVISITDTYPIDMYLMRYAKKIGAKSICLQSGLHAINLNDVSWVIDRINAHFKFPRRIPLLLRIFLVKIRKYTGHLLYNFIFPFCLFEVPFFGTGMILYSPSGFRADYQVAYSEQDYKLNLEEGLPENKLYILKHPMARSKTKDFFKSIYFSDLKKNENGKVMIVLYPSDKINFKAVDKSIFGEEQVEEEAVKIIRMASEILKEWIICIKAHPISPVSDNVLKKIEKIKNVKITKPSDPLDECIELSDAMIVLSGPSTGVLTASYQKPEMPILTIDFQKNLFYDFYDNFQGVQYVTNEHDFSNILNKIKNNEFKRRPLEDHNFKKEKEFKSAVEMVDFFLKKNEL